jgi:hypothetical protein
VLKVPLAGGTPTTLASEDADAVAAAIDATSVYWTTVGAYSPGVGGETGTVKKVPIDGGAATTLASRRTSAGFS